LVWKAGRGAGIKDLPACGKHCPGPDQPVGQNYVALFEEERAILVGRNHKPNIRKKAVGGKAGSGGPRQSF
jgi:hypothetical protein